jgi:hypothetical protein
MAIQRRKFLALLGMGAPVGFFGKRFPTLRGLREYFLNHPVSAVPEASTDYGPLTPLVKDKTVTDILVNRFDRIYVERAGKLALTPLTFKDNTHLMQIIERIVSRVGRRVDESSPMVDARLADGSRVHAIIPPLALDGPYLSIRRLGREPVTARQAMANEKHISALMTVQGCGLLDELRELGEAEATKRGCTVDAGEIALVIIEKYGLQDVYEAALKARAEFKSVEDPAITAKVQALRNAHASSL